MPYTTDTIPAVNYTAYTTTTATIPAVNYTAYTTTTDTIPAVNYTAYTNNTTATVGATITGYELNFNYYVPDERKIIFNIENLRYKNINIQTEKRRGDSRQVLEQNVDPQELVARDTLRLMITEKEYRRYITNGFVMAKGDSGLWYQIFAHHRSQLIRVYKKGVQTDKLCIHTDKDCPLTDHVINVLTMIRFDEQSLWANSNNNVLVKDVPEALSLRIVSKPRLGLVA